MKILYSPQRNSNILEYTFEGEVVTVTQKTPLEEVEGEMTYLEQSDIFDFTSFGDGVLQDIATTLPVTPILSAKRKDGVLSLVLLSYLSDEATEEQRFPQWIEV